MLGTLPVHAHSRLFVSRPAFSRLSQERLGTALGCFLIPALGGLLLCCTGLIAAGDADVRSGFANLVLVVVGVTALSTVVAALSVVRAGRARERQAPLLDELVLLTGGERPQVGSLAAPRVWCTVGNARFSVVTVLQGRAGPALATEEEDPFRELWLKAASAPNARLPRGRHWRFTVSGDAPSAYRLVIAAKGPLSLVGARLTGLERVQSGDARFDDWVVVFSDRPEAAGRLVSDADRRDTLLALVTSNGPYTTSLQFGPPRSPRDPCVVHGFVLHEQQTAETMVENMKGLLRVASWTHDTA